MRFRIIILFILLASCDPKHSIKGSWYTDSKDGRGYRDTVSHYVEIYMGDSIIKYQEEMFGQIFDQQYFVRNDTIFKCFGTDKDCEFIPMYRIKKFTQDTVWLTINPEYEKKNNQTFWVRLPKGEYGRFDLNWTSENEDSLAEKVRMDYDRRREKYFALKKNRLPYFDSLLKAGTWDWNMKVLREWEEANKPRPIKNKYTVDDLPIEIPDSLKELFGDTTRSK